MKNLVKMKSFEKLNVDTTESQPKLGFPPYLINYTFDFRHFLGPPNRLSFLQKILSVFLKNYIVNEYKQFECGIRSCYDPIHCKVCIALG